MTNAEGMPEFSNRNKRGIFFVIRASSLFRHSPFELRHFPHSSSSAEGAFTAIELLVVISIIIILAGLILATTGYVEKKGARSRAESEIAAMSAAMESYKADNGIYPRGNANLSTNCPYDTDNLDAQTAGNPTTYQLASLFLYKQLSGDTSANLQPPAGAKSYFTFKPQMLYGPKDSNGNLTGVTYIKDPFGNSYGYSTAYANYLDQVNGTGCYTTPNPSATVRGYNPSFDLWSTDSLNTNPPTSTITAQWVKNW
jgi:type II secretory pathway pseudopilin PulG